MNSFLSILQPENTFRVPMKAAKQFQQTPVHIEFISMWRFCNFWLVPKCRIATWSWFEQECEYAQAVRQLPSTLPEVERSAIAEPQLPCNPCFAQENRFF